MTRKQRQAARAAKLRWLLERTHRPPPKEPKQSRADFLYSWYLANQRAHPRNT